MAYLTKSGLTIELTNGPGPDRPIDDEMKRAGWTADEVFQEMERKTSSRYPYFCGLALEDRGVYVASISWTEADDWTRTHRRCPWPLPGHAAGWVVKCAANEIIQATVDRSDWIDPGNYHVGVYLDLAEAIARVDRMWSTQ